MIVTPNMGLKRWNDPNDLFSFTELSDSVALIDAHDHSTGKGVQVPTGGIANLAVTETKIANDAVTVNKVLNGSLTDAKLASPNNGAWRTIWSIGGCYVQAFANAAPVWLVPGQAPIPIANSTAYTVHCFNPTPAVDLAVAGKTTKVRGLGTMRTNGVGGSGVTFTFALSRVNVSGATGMVLTQAAAPLGFSWVSPAANSVIRATSVESDYTSVFSVETGTFAPVLTFNAASAANHTCSIDLAIQIRYV